VSHLNGVTFLSFAVDKPMRKVLKMTVQDLVSNADKTVDPASFRRVMSTYPTGVTIITAEGPSGPVGMTANSFTSVSLDPPMVLFCASLTSSTWPRIRTAASFVVNLMSHRGVGLAATFAKPGIDRFAGVLHSPGITGAPVLAEADAFLECELTDTYRIGDHAVAIGRVVAVGGAAADSPLIFHRSQLHTPGAR